jgi:predicted nucleic acid-binding protein
MTVLIDTNVILDLFIRREPHYENAARINVLSEKGYIDGYVSASAVTDIYYVAKKELGNKEIAVGLLENLLKTIHIAAVTEAGIHEALDLRWDDFEDSVQYVVGQSILADYIVTRNPNDYISSNITVVSPAELLNLIASNQRPQPPEGVVRKSQSS